MPKIKSNLKGQIIDPTACLSSSQGGCFQTFNGCFANLFQSPACSTAFQNCSERGCSNCQGACFPELTREATERGATPALLTILLQDVSKYSSSKNFFIAKIEAYQKLVDPKLKKALGVKKICRYTPTCSQYGKKAIKKHGSAKGIALTAWRIMRCNPFSKGGRDPV